jgi:hypothetical protein
MKRAAAVLLFKGRVAFGAWATPVPYSDIGSRQRPACEFDECRTVDVHLPSQTAIFPTLRLLRSTMSEVLQGSTSVFLCLCLGPGA